MPRYYFEIFENDQSFPDEDGSEHQNDREAGNEAVGALVYLAKDKLPDNSDHRELVAKVMDDSRKLVFHATLSF